MGCCSRLAMVAAVLSFTNIAAAQAPSPPAPGPMARAGYSVPWSLRPAVAANIVRLDSVYSVASHGNAWVSILTAGYRPVRSLPTLGLLFRSGVVGSYPGSGGSAWALTSPTFIALFTPEIAPHVRLAPTLAFSLPIGAAIGLLGMAGGLSELDQLLYRRVPERTQVGCVHLRVPVELTEELVDDRRCRRQLRGRRCGTHQHHR